ncbi:MAG: DUF2167 domain-containing protein, partial [Bacteroidota bacterium]
MRISHSSLISLCLVLPAFGFAQMSLEAIEADSLQLEMEALFQAQMDSLEGTLTFYEDTSLIIGGDMAMLHIPDGYMYIGPSDSRTVLEDMWGNPPNSIPSLGMLFPENFGPASEFGYGIDIFFEQEGYIRDDDATDIDYDDL